MKKILFLLSLLSLTALMTMPIAIGYYVGESAYVSSYAYDYSSSYYGPMPHYSSTRPVYRVTSTNAMYGVPLYGTTAPAYTPPSVYSYDYSYRYQNTPVYGPAAYSSQKFVDVSPNDPHYAAIQWVGLNSIAGGFDGGRFFQPNRNITRAEKVAMIVKGARTNPAEQTYHHCFSDVATEWYANEVCFAKMNGWLPAHYGNQFKGSEPITAVDARNILVRAYGVDPAMPNTTYITRAQAAGILYALLSSGSVSVNYNNNPYYNYNAPQYIPSPAPAVPAAPVSGYYRYNPYTSTYSNRAYCDIPYNYAYYYGSSYSNYCDYSTSSNYNYAAYTPYYGEGYSRNVRYYDPWTVHVPSGYNGPWN